MTDQALIYARVALVILAALAVGYVLLTGQPNAATTIAAILAALGSLLAFVQIQKATNQIERSITQVGVWFQRSADIERTTIKRE